MTIGEFFKTLNWSATGKVALIRVCLGATVWAVLYSLLNLGSGFFITLFSWFAILGVAMAVALPAIGLSRAGVPFAGLLSFPAWLVVVGDPIVLGIRKMYPDLVPVDKFGFVNAPVLGIFNNVEVGYEQTIQSSSNLEGSPEEKARALCDEGAVLLNNYLALAKSSNGSPDGEHVNDLKLAAFKCYEDAIEVDPNCIDANIWLADKYYKMDCVEYAETIFAYTKAVLNIEPNNDQACFLLCNTHFALGQRALDNEDWNTATIEFIASYEIEPSKENLALVLTHCAEEGGMLDLAIATFEKRLEFQPDDETARLLIGRSYAKQAINNDLTESSRQEMHRQGVKFLEDFVNQFPEHVDANYWLGALYVMAARDDEVNVIIERLRLLDPDMSADLEEMLK